MKNAGILERARIAREAQAEVHAAFAQVVRRNDNADLRTRRWQEAIQRFYKALREVYPPWLDGPLSEAHNWDILDFLEADPMCDRSGYVKGQLLGELKKRSLDRKEARQLQDIILNVVRHRDDREFRRYCQAAANVDDDRMRKELAEISQHKNVNARRRARWVIEALDHAKSTRTGLARSGGRKPFH